jgi:hypothetical protein
MCCWTSRAGPRLQTLASQGRCCRSESVGDLHSVLGAPYLWAVLTAYVWVMPAHSLSSAACVVLSGVCNRGRNLLVSPVSHPDMWMCCAWLLCRFKDPHRSYLSVTHQGGTPNYMAPELFNARLVIHGEVGRCCLADS